MTPEQCYEKVRHWLVELFGVERIVSDGEDLTLGVAVGSAMAQVAVKAFGEDDAVLVTRAYVATGVDPTYELLDFLLHENNKALFGGFGMEGRDVFFQHSVLGSTCDPPELKSSVMAVVLIADRYDDEITTRWGGERASDRALHG